MYLRVYTSNNNYLIEFTDFSLQITRIITSCPSVSFLLYSHYKTFPTQYFLTHRSLLVCPPELCNFSHEEPELTFFARMEVAPAAPQTLWKPLRRGTPLPLGQLVEESRSRANTPNRLLESSTYYT